MANCFERIFWNFYARSYDNLAMHFRPYRDLMMEVCDHLDRIASGRSLRILDAGCGTGNYSWELARRGHEVIGIDSSSAMLALAEGKKTTNRSPMFKAQDLMQPLNFQNGEFDAAVCIHVFYTLPDPGVLADQLRRVVRDGGSVIAVTLQQPVTVGGSLMEAYQEGGFSLALKTFFALFGVGICNLVISARQKKGSYRNMDEQVFRDFLETHNIWPQHVNTTYTCGISVLAVADVSSS